jgi:hypothetical protein
MKLFEIKEYNLQIDNEVWGLLPFKAILKKDKSRNKTKEIIKDVGLPEDWKIDNIVRTAIEFYESRSITPIGKLYKSSLKAADDVSKYLEITDTLLTERTANGGTVTTLPMIMTSLKSVPAIMRDLKAAYKEVLAEQKELEGKSKGSRSFGMFEDGLI